MTGVDMDEVYALASTVMSLGRVRRLTEHPEGEKESVTTHTVMLALLALVLCPDHLDREYVVMYALVHDLPEAFAGDTPTLNGLTEEERVAKKERETAALKHIRWNVSKGVAALIAGYERQDTAEARFVHGLDKALPKVTHLMTGCRVVKEQGMSKSDLATFLSKQHVDLLNERVPYEAMDVYARLTRAVIAAYDEPSRPREET